MLYADEQIELLKRKSLKAESKVDGLQKINFYLDDFTPSFSKTYYFTFTTEGGKVYVDYDKRGVDSVKLTVGNVRCISGGSFFLKKGTYEVKAEIEFSSSQSAILFYVYGKVKYYHNSFVKCVNGQDQSYISYLNDSVLKLYRYDGALTIVDSVPFVEKSDITLGDGLYVCYLQEGQVSLKCYFSGGDSLVVPISSSCVDVLCDYAEKIRIYILKNGVLHVLEGDENLNFTDVATPIKAKKLFAVKREKIVYEDYSGRVRFCRSCFPTE